MSLNGWWEGSGLIMSIDGNTGTCKSSNWPHHEVNETVLRINSQEGHRHLADHKLGGTGEWASCVITLEDNGQLLMDISGLKVFFDSKG